MICMRRDEKAVAHPCESVRQAGISLRGSWGSRHPQVEDIVYPEGTRLRGLGCGPVIDLATPSPKLSSAMSRTARRWLAGAAGARSRSAPGGGGAERRPAVGWGLRAAVREQSAVVDTT